MSVRVLRGSRVDNSIDGKIDGKIDGRIYCLMGSVGLACWSVCFCLSVPSVPVCLSVPPAPPDGQVLVVSVLVGFFGVGKNRKSWEPRSMIS